MKKLSEEERNESRAEKRRAALAKMRGLVDEHYDIRRMDLYQSLIRRAVRLRWSLRAISAFRQLF
jgi:hypothetical protein